MAEKNNGGGNNPNPGQPGPKGDADDWLVQRAREMQTGGERDKGEILAEPVDTDRRRFLRGALGTLGLFTTAAAVTSPVTAATRHIILANEEEREGASPEKIMLEGRERSKPTRMLGETPVYDSVTKIINESTYWDPEYTGGRFAKLAEIFREMFTSKSDVFYYYTVEGEIVSEAAIPQKGATIEWEDGETEIAEKGWPLSVYSEKERKKRKKYWTAERRQKFHNARRIQAAPPEGIVIPDPTDATERKKTGYPLTAVSLPVGAGLENVEEVTALEQIKERLNEELSDPRYFEGKETKLGDAIKKIAEEYGVPVSIAKGLGAQESSFYRGRKNKFGRVITTTSSANAKGIYQFLPETAEREAKPFLLSEQSFRDGEIGACSAEVNNRFVQAELFCAHYIFLKEKQKPYYEKLKLRLQKIDSGFDTDLMDLIITSSYNAGKARIQRTIDRFVELSDEEIIYLIGKPPYGADVWLGVLANSFGQDRVGPHVFHYSLKVFSWAGLLEDEDPIEDFLVERPPESGVFGGANALEAPKNIVADTAGAMAAIGISAGALSWAKKQRGGEVNRRDVLRMGGAAAGLGALVVASGWRVGRSKGFSIGCGAERYKKGQEYTWDTLPLEHEVYADVLYATAEDLDELYAAMRTRGSFEYTKKERANRRKYKITENYALLEDVFDEALGENFKPKKWKKAVKKHQAWMEEEEKEGDFIRMAEDDPNMPYFCQQVGRGGGRTDNDPDSLLMRKEFEPLMGTLVALVNYQIDLFNENPKAYGYGDIFIHTVENTDGSTFVEHARIPHISAIKISGASRTLDHQYNGIGAMAAKTLPSAHTVGHALDMGALTRATDEFKIVRFVEPFIYDGKEQIPAGGKLSAAGFGGTTRKILSGMIGRALMAMEEHLTEHQGITLQPLWESFPQNWHTVIKPADESFRAKEPEVVYGKKKKDTGREDPEPSKKEPYYPEGPSKSGELRYPEGPSKSGPIGMD